MSQWTHITSCMSVDTCIEEPNNVLLDLVHEFLSCAPKITGSERDADVFVNIQSGHNAWTSADCDHCVYGKTIVHLNEGGFQCDAKEGYECPEGEYQTCIVISIQGDLRDRIKQETQKEFDAFKRYIENQYIIRDYSLNIEGE